MVDIVNIINVSEQTQGRTLGFYNVNNVMLFTNEKPVADFGSDVYRAYVTYSDVVTDWGTDSDVAAVALKVFAQSPSLLGGNGQLLIAGLHDDENLADGITRLSGVVYFGGVLSAQILDDEAAGAASDVVQTMDTIFVLPQSKLEVIQEGGTFAKIINKGNFKTKCFLYTLGDDEAVAAAGAYISRAFAVNYSAQNACLTMNLKDLAGVEPDTGITQTIYNNLKSLGVDCYCAIEGLPKVISNAPSGGQYFDELHDRLWFKQALKVTYFNVLAGTATKIPQTEAGMTSVKNAIRGVCDQAVYNGFLAPGTWNGSDKFGNVEDFVRNIADFGYYIYAAPLSQQSQTERQSRVAPVVQIAGKEAGAFHSGSIIVQFEA